MAGDFFGSLQILAGSNLKEKIWREEEKDTAVRKRYCGKAEDLIWREEKIWRDEKSGQLAGRPITHHYHQGHLPTADRS